jgi:bleomycin hydrolase
MGSAASKQAGRAETPYDDEKQVITSFSSLRLVPGSPRSSDGSVTLTNLAAWESTASADSKIQLSRTILSHTNIRAALTSREAYIADRHVFNNEIEFKTGPITNQRSSGRCWLFATTNMLRYDVMRKLKLKEFQLSQVR